MTNILPVLVVGLSISLFSRCAPSPIQKTASTVETPLPAKAVFASLTWKPNVPLEDLDLEPLAIFKNTTLTIASLEDTRADVRIIGKTLEDKKIQDVFVPLATKSSVAKWCQSGTRKALTDMQLPIDEKKGALRLELELNHLEIEDNITQKGTMEFRVTAHTGEDLLIWEGNIHGSSDLYYRPKDSDGISECLSNTLKVTINNIFVDQSFRDAVIKTFELE